jgi:hypothetical protein
MGLFFMTVFAKLDCSGQPGTAINALHARVRNWPVRAYLKALFDAFALTVPIRSGMIPHHNLPLVQGLIDHHDAVASHLSSFGSFISRRPLETQQIHAASFTTTLLFFRSVNQPVTLFSLSSSLALWNREGKEQYGIQIYRVSRTREAPRNTQHPSRCAL